MYLASLRDICILNYSSTPVVGALTLSSYCFVIIHYFYTHNSHCLHFCCFQCNLPNRKKASGLIELLLKRPDRDFYSFCKALENANQGEIVTRFLTPEHDAGKMHTIVLLKLHSVIYIHYHKKEISISV